MLVYICMAAPTVLLWLYTIYGALLLWVFAARLPSQLPSAPLHFRMNMVYTIIMSCHLLGNKRTIMMFYLCFARVRVSFGWM